MEVKENLVLRIALTMLAALFAASSVLAADGGAPGADAPVVQPEKIPGNWKVEPLPLPPLEEIAKRPATGPVYGLYLWGGDYIKYRRRHQKSRLEEFPGRRGHG